MLPVHILFLFAVTAIVMTQKASEEKDLVKLFNKSLVPSFFVVYGILLLSFTLSDSNGAFDTLYRGMISEIDFPIVEWSIDGMNKMYQSFTDPYTYARGSVQFGNSNSIRSGLGHGLNDFYDGLIEAYSSFASNPFDADMAVGLAATLFVAYGFLSLSNKKEPEKSEQHGDKVGHNAHAEAHAEHH